MVDDALNDRGRWWRRADGDHRAYRHASEPHGGVERQREHGHCPGRQHHGSPFRCKPATVGEHDAVRRSRLEQAANAHGCGTDG
jgi:hypothetical protein